MERLNKDNFIKKATELHNGKYSYDKSVYVKASEKVIITCPEHGDFLLTPSSHMNGRGCPKCACKLRNKSQQGTKESFIQKAIPIHGDKYDYSKVVYKQYKTKVEIICPKHGSFWQTPDSHINKKSGCPKCKGDKVVQTHSYPKELWILLCKEKYGDKYDYSKAEYVNYVTPVIITCPIHGDFITRPNIHYKSVTGCPKCGREKANESEKYTKELFIEKAKKVHGDKYDYSKVNYINAFLKVTIVCPKHGEFELNPANHLSGQGCPRCTLVSQTKLYDKLIKSFNNVTILFEVSAKTVPWLGKRRLDIYFPEYNIAVEYHGIQHYYPIEYFGGMERFKQQIIDDESRRILCKNNNCTLFEVKYNYNEDDYNKLVNDILKIMNINSNIESTTEKLEEYYKQYNETEDLSKKDEIAIKCGKFLTKEILENTDDKTGLLNEVNT